jgi:hypothetical protein
MSAHRQQDQRSVTEQMRDVVTMANIMGKYDAADWILRNFFDRPSDYVPPGKQGS